MRRRNTSDGFVGIRFSRYWLDQFKSKYHITNLSKAIRNLVYNYYPIEQQDPLTLKIKEKAREQAKIKSEINRLQKEYEFITHELNMYQKLRDKQKESKERDVNE